MQPCCAVLVEGTVRSVLALLVLIVLAPPAWAYDPLKPLGGEPRVLDLAVDDRARNREIPVRVYLPQAKGPQPVVLFSHGLGGSREGSSYLGRHWAARGYVAVFLQHPGSDSSVWRDVPAAQRMASLRKAASAQNLRLRVGDVGAVLDQLEVWNATTVHTLAGRLDLRRVGMSGHSFGAVTTQWVGGQQLAGRSIADPRIGAALMMSPSVPELGNPSAAFGRVRIPWMLMTGTRDVAIIVKADVPSRLKVFPALPPGSKYELILDGAEHSAFSERSLPGETGKRNPNHHRVILALSTAFWDSCLRQDPAARTWLDGKGPASVLEPRDRWRRK